jgi:hypothetical protein
LFAQRFASDQDILAGIVALLAKSWYWSRTADIVRVLELDHVTSHLHMTPCLEVVKSSGAKIQHPLCAREIGVMQEVPSAGQFGSW